MNNQQADCPICYDALQQDVCIINCAAAHAFHYKCMVNAIQQGIKACPLDRQNVTKCMHDGFVKILPNPPKKQPQPQIQIILQLVQTPCYICHCNTRGDLQFDEVVVCSGCELIFCHAQCQQRLSSRRFNYDIMWFCPACRNARQRNTRQRRTILNRH